jgi:predicted RNA-binding protein YlqC (UPF0109 family)
MRKLLAESWEMGRVHGRRGKVVKSGCVS